MAKIGLFYGSSTYNTEYTAYDVRDMIDARLGEGTVRTHNVGIDDADAMLAYDYLIFGVPTWDIGELQADWDFLWSDLRALDLSGKQVAVFGLGDQYGYPDTFLDAAGMLAELVLEVGGQLVGYTSSEGYEFEESMFIEDGQFMGLALDEDSQPEMTGERLQHWIPQIIEAFALADTAQVTATG